MTETLKKHTLEQLTHLRKSLITILNVTDGEMCRPFHQGKPGEQTLQSYHDWLADQLGDIEQEIGTRPVKNYDDALHVFNMYADWENGEAHFAKVLDLINFKPAEEAA